MKEVVQFFILICFSCLMISCLEDSTGDDPCNGLFVRNGHAMVFHAVDEKIYLFGGADEKEVKSDMWLFEQNRWNEISFRKGPEPRTFPSLVFEDKNERLVLFGGNKVLFGDTTDVNNLLNDTWEFRKGKWKQIQTNNYPPPRAEAIMVYDSIRERTVLFGGYTIKGEQYQKLGDTWEFYNNEWHLVAQAGPSRRNGAASSYDNFNNWVVLIGGSSVDRQYGPSRGETWFWKNNKWYIQLIDHPKGMYNAAMAYDKAGRQLVRFGGWDGDQRTNETWTFKDNRWKSIELPRGPGARNHSAMVYDEIKERMILFGGHDGDNVFGDTWEFKDGNWNQLSDCGFLKRQDNNH